MWKGRLRRELGLRLAWRRLRGCEIFDADYYRNTYPDVRRRGVDPLRHYVFFGSFEDRDPHPLFDTSYYLSQYPDVAKAGVNPLLDFITCGAAKRRNPHPLFDTAFYLEQYPDVLTSGMDPLSHFLGPGTAEGLDPNRSFHTTEYLEAHPEVVQQGINPLVHFALRNPPPAAPEPRPQASELRAALRKEWEKTGCRLPVRAGETPVVSVIIPCFNYGRFLEDAVLSALVSCSRPIEVIVVDDGSTESATVVEIDRLEKKYRLSLVRQKNGGLSTARNAGLKAARGKFIQFLDADDLLIDHCLDRQLDCLEKRPKIDIALCDYALCNVVGERRQRPEPSTIAGFSFTLDDFLFKWERGLSIPIHCAVFRQSAIQDVRWSTQVKAKEDWIFWIELAKRNVLFNFDPAARVLYRHHGENMVTKREAMGLNFLRAAMNVASALPESSAFAEASLEHFRTTYLEWIKQDAIEPNRTRAVTSALRSGDLVSGVRISVVVPVYNHAEYLAATIDSLIDQSLPAAEIILVDDCSPDRRVGDILSRYMERPGVKIMSHPRNMGISAALNTAIMASTGSFVAFVDCDDLLEPDALERVAMAIRAAPGVGFFYSDRLDIDEQGKPLMRWDFAGRSREPTYDALLQGMFTSHLKVVNRDYLLDVGLFKSRFDLTQDYDFSIRMAEKCRFLHIPEPIYRHRVHSGQQTQLNLERQEMLAETARSDAHRRSDLRQGKLGGMVSVVLVPHGEADLGGQSVERLVTNIRIPCEFILGNDAANFTGKKCFQRLQKGQSVRVLSTASCTDPTSPLWREATRTAKGNFLFFLASDVIITDPDFFPKMIERLLEEPEAVACCAKVALSNRRLQSNGGVITRTEGRFVRFEPLDAGKRDHDLSTMAYAPCDWLPNGATLWRRDMFERFLPTAATPHAFEIYDVCLQVRQAGLRLLNCPTAKVARADATTNPVSHEYLRAHYSPEQLLASLASLYRNHGVVIDDDEIFKIVGCDRWRREEVVERIASLENVGVSTRGAVRP